MIAVLIDSESVSLLGETSEDEAVVWIQLSPAKRFRIWLSRKYAADNWSDLWRRGTLVQLIAEHSALLCAAARFAAANGEPELTL